MWIRMGAFQVKSGEAATLSQTYNERAVPKVRACEGNVGCLLLEPQGDETQFVVITIWESRAAAERYEASGAAAEVVALVRRHFAGPPTLRSFESNSTSGL